MSNKFQEHMKNSRGKIMSVCLVHRQRIWRCGCEKSRKWFFIEELKDNGFSEEEILTISQDNPPED